MKPSPSAPSPSRLRGEIPRSVLFLALALGAPSAGCAATPPLPDHYWLDHAPLPRQAARVERTAREEDAIDAVVEVGLTQKLGGPVALR